MKHITKISNKTHIHDRVNFNYSTLLKPFLLVFFFLTGSTVFAQDQFLWIGGTGATANDWNNAANWLHVPVYGGGTAPATYYPGQLGGINSGGPKDDVVFFVSAYPINCNINANIRVGGIHVQGYTGTITQNSGMRFNVSESNDAGGNGPWDGTSTVSSTDANISPYNGTASYRADFNFGTGGSFVGTSGGTYTPNYSVLFACPLTITGGTFIAPTGTDRELRIRHNATITAANFSHNNGVAVLSNRSGGLLTRDYDFGGVNFHDLKASSAVQQMYFYNASNIIVENDFYTAGLHGVPGGASGHFSMWSVDGAAIEIKKDLIVGNIFYGPSYTGQNAYGDMHLIMNGTTNQRIEHTYSNVNFTGNLPYLEINNNGAIVTIEGPVTVNGEIKFVDGVVHPDDPSTTQDDLLSPNDLFVVNSNCIVDACTDDSYCEGPIRVRTGKQIELPVGKDGYYRPAVIRPVSGVSIDYSTDNMYTAEYMPDSPTTDPIVVGVTNRETGLNQVSDCELWAIQREENADTYAMDLELSYDNASCTGFLFDNRCRLVVARWDVTNNQWESHSKATSFDLACVSNSDFTLHSDLDILTADFERSTSKPDLFTFGDYGEDLCDSCLVSVYVDYCVDSCEFTFSPNIDLGITSTFESIFWDFGTYGSSNLMNPSVTYTSTGVQEVKVTVCAFSGVDTCCVTHTFYVYANGCEPVSSMAPLVIGEQKNVEETTKDEFVNPLSNGIVKIVPNPSYEGSVQIGLETEEDGIFNYTITNNQGQNLINGNVSSRELNRIDTSTLAPGIYFITVYLSNEKVTERIVIGR